MTVLLYATLCSILGTAHTAVIEIVWLASSRSPYNFGVHSSVGSVQYALSVINDNRNLLNGHNFT